MSDEDKVVHLLASLPKSFDMLVTAVPSMEKVTERLLHEMKGTSESGNDKAMAASHKFKKKGPKCYNCGKLGHIKKN